MYLNILWYVLRLHLRPWWHWKWTPVSGEENASANFLIWDWSRPKIGTGAFHRRQSGLPYLPVVSCLVMDPDESREPNCQVKTPLDSVHSPEVKKNIEPKTLHTS